MEKDINKVKNKLDKLLANGNIKLIDKSYYINNHDQIILNNKERITDSVIDSLISAAQKVLSYTNPSLQYKAKTRLAEVMISGQKPNYSDEIRKSICESLAVIKNNAESFKNCSLNYIENSIDGLIDGVLEINKKDWKFWNSNASILPIIAEISPNNYIKHLRSIVAQNDKVIKNILEQDDSIFCNGDSTILNIRTSLQILAYDKDYFIECINLLLALAKYETAANGENGYLNTIINIINPYKPQTNYPEDKIPTTIINASINQSLKYKLYKKLLPNNKNNTFIVNGIKPKWMKCDKKYENIDSINENRYNKNYYKHFNEYAREFIKASNSYANIYSLIEEIPYLPDIYADEYEAIFNDKRLQRLSIEKKNEIWQYLFVNSQKIKSDKLSSKINTILKKYEPKDIIQKYQILFDQQDGLFINDYRHYDEQLQTIQQKAVTALEEIYEKKNLDGVQELIQKSKYTDKIAYAIYQSKYKDQFLPIAAKLIDSKNSKENDFSYMYIRLMSETYALEELLQIIKFKDMRKTNKLKILLSVKPNSDTWELVRNEKCEQRYWSKIQIQPYEKRNKCDTETIIINLNKVCRHTKSLEFIVSSIYKKEKINIELVASTLLDLRVDKTKTIGYTDSNNILEIIEFLHNEKYDGFNMAMIELRYIALFNKWDKKSTPNNLVLLLANNPKYFCDIYDKMFSGEKNSFQFYKVTHDFGIVPGINKDGIIINKTFNKWIKYTENYYSKDADKLKSVKSTVGQNLAPSSCYKTIDNDTIIKFLNNEKNSDYRNGFILGVINSRGVVSIDEQFSEEKKIISIWENKAIDIEACGYNITAKLYRDVANSFKDEIKRMDLMLKKRRISEGA